MPKLRTLGVAVSSCVGVLALAGTALACTNASLALGPVPVPNVPVQVCVTQTDVPGEVRECVSTPTAESVSLVVNAHAETPTTTVEPPKIVPIACPTGTQGAAAQVSTGSASTTVSGSVTVVRTNGGSTTVPIKRVVAAGGQSAKVFACAGVSPGAAPLQ
jgi:hypothetical protein